MSQATAQAGHSVVACRDRNMNVVACSSGGGGGGGAGLPNMLGGIDFFSLGGAIVKSLMDDGGAAAQRDAERQQQEAEQQRQAAAAASALRAKGAQDHTLFLQDQERRRQAEMEQQHRFATDQKALASAMRTLDAPASSPSPAPQDSGGSSLSGGGALGQLRAADLQVRDIGFASTAGTGDIFDQGAATAKQSGPLMTVKGVPKFADVPPTPAADPKLQPMTLDQRALLAERNARQGELDALRAKRAAGQIDAETAAREEARLQQEIDQLMRRFAELPPALASAPPIMASDASVVDLREARTSTVDPTRMSRGQTSKQPAAPDALQRSNDEDMKLLFPDSSAWPGPRNPDQPLLNPLREREQYLALLTEEAKRFPKNRAKIEKLRAALDTDAEREQRFAGLRDEIMKRRNTAITAADEKYQQGISNVLDPLVAQTGASDRQDLFAKARLDPALRQKIEASTKPIETAWKRDRDRAENRTLTDLFGAFDKVYPDAFLH